mmetsp:Transcript_11264/g.30663  ORF Transcript_11264/g.30663 Transcript_11264/m.30663 type:complete len:84 (+) Transcript_11264:80-331(+)
MELHKALALFFFAFSFSLLSQGLAVFNLRSADWLPIVQALCLLAGAASSMAAGIGLASERYGLFQEVAQELQPRRERSCGGGC